MGRLPITAAAAASWDGVSSIGTDSRDFSTITLWNAALGGAAGGAGINARGECYADSDFEVDETLTINNTTPTSVVLSVADGHRHDGTANSGVRVLFSTAGLWQLYTPGLIVEWIEYDCNGNGVTSYAFDMNTSGGNQITVQQCIIHDVVDTSTCHAVWCADPSRVLNCIIYDILTSHTGAGVCSGIYGNNSSGDELSIYNNTVDRIVNNGGSGPAYGIFLDDDNAAKNAYNNAATQVSGTTSGTTACYGYAGVANSTVDYNLDDDNTLPGGVNNQVSKAVGDQYVSVADGSEDYHLKIGADCIGNGTDLGDGVDGTETDIDGVDRNAAGFTWDIGADQYTYKYWVGDTDNDWNDTDNWAVSSGGAGGAGVPTAYEDVVFDDQYTPGNGDCTLDVAFDIGSLTVLGTYDGKLDFADAAYGHSCAGDMIFDGTDEVDCGNATITCSGNFDNKDQTTWTRGTSTLVMDGAGKNLTSHSTKDLYNLTISGSVTLHADTSSYIDIDNILEVTGTLTLDDYMRVRDGSVTNTGTIQDGGSGFLQISGPIDNSAGIAWTVDTRVVKGSSISTGTYGGTWTCHTGHVSNNYTLTFGGATTFTGDVTFDANGTGTYTVDFAGFSHIFQGAWAVGASAAGDVTILNDADPDFMFQGDVTISEAVGTVSYTKGSGTITLSGANAQSIDFNGEAVEDIHLAKTADTADFTGAFTTDSLTVDNANLGGSAVLNAVMTCVGVFVVETDATGTFDFNTGSHTVGGDFTCDGDGTVDCGDATITCSGDFDNQHQTTWTQGTSTLVLAGAGKETLFKSNTYNILTVSGSYTLHRDGGSPTLSGLFTVSNGGTVTFPANSNDEIDAQAGTVIAGTIDVQNGIMKFRTSVTLAATGSITQSGGVVKIGGNSTTIDNSAGGTWSADLQAIRNITVSAGTYGGDWVCTQNDASNNRTFTFDGACIFTGSMSWDNDKASRTYTIDNSGNHDLVFQGDVTLSNSFGVAITWTKGSGTITLSGSNNQSIDFNGEAVEDIVVNKSAGDVTLTGTLTTDSFTGTSTGTGDFDPNGQTITTTGDCDWAAAFTFETGDTDVMDGSDWQIGGNFTADGQTLPADSGWDLDVTGTAVASGAGDVSHSTAGGTEIDASGNPWTDSGNNTNWNFGAGGPAGVASQIIIAIAV